MFDLRSLRLSDAGYYQPYSRQKAAEIRWPRRDARNAPSPARPGRLHRLGNP